MTRPITVFTGDLIASTDLPEGKIALAMDALRGAADEIGHWQVGTPGARFTRHRGDGWQMVLHEPRLALRAALYLRANLRVLGKRFATRIALATGSEALTDGADLSQDTGQTFVRSGRALDAMPKGVGLVWAAAGPTGALFRLADHVSAGWTPSQAKATALLLHPGKMTHTEAALALNISRQAVDQALAGAGYPALRDALDMIEAAEPPHAS